MTLKPPALLLLAALALLLTQITPGTPAARAAGEPPPRMALFESFMRPG